MFNDRQPQVRHAFDLLQQRWAEELPDIQHEAVKFIQAGNPQGRKLLTQFTERCARQALEICTNLIAEFDGKCLPLTPPCGAGDNPTHSGDIYRHFPP
jgi:hypothetical protein